MSLRTKYKSSRRKAIRGSVARRTHSRKGPRRSTQFKQSKRTRVSRGSVRAHRSTLSYLNKKRRGGHYRDNESIEYMRALQQEHQLCDPPLVDQAIEEQAMEEQSQQRDRDIEYMKEFALLEELDKNRTPQHVPEKKIRNRFIKRISNKFRGFNNRNQTSGH